MDLYIPLSVLLIESFRQDRLVFVERLIDFVKSGMDSLCLVGKWVVSFLFVQFALEINQLNTWVHDCPVQRREQSQHECSRVSCRHLQ